MAVKIGSLFTGYGGLDMAAEAAFDATTAWVADIDKGACKVLAHRYPDVPNLGDITVTDWSTVEPVDIITGGSPCQDLSHAGRRAGMTEGTRSNLWVAMREAIAQIRPAYVIWENVRGAYSAAADSAVEPCPGCVGDGSGVNLRALHRVLGDLSDLGYDCQWRGLRAADVGAPHERFRVFVVARLADAERGGRNGRSRTPRRSPFERVATDGRPQGALLPTPRSSDGDKGLRTLAGATTEFARKGDGADLATILALLPTPAVNDMGAGKSIDQWDAWTERMKREHGNGNGHGASLAIELERLGGTWKRFAPTVLRWERVVDREAPAPSEGALVREWMMGLPAGWITDVPGVTRNEALKACGNGVVPQQAFAAITDSLAAWAEAAA